MNIYNDFRKFSIDKQRLSGTFVDDISKHMGSIASMTPNIIEETPLNATVLDIFSRMIRDRIIWLWGPVDDSMASIISAQLMYLDSVGSSDIMLNCCTPGGSCSSGLTLIDIIDYIACDVSTINMGMCASMGSVLLGSAKVGKRLSLPNAKVMIHQVSSSQKGMIKDLEIEYQETKKVNDVLFNLLGKYTNKTSEQVKLDADRDYWMTAQEAKDYGIIDDIIKSKKKNK